MVVMAQMDWTKDGGATHVTGADCAAAAHAPVVT